LERRKPVYAPSWDAVISAVEPGWVLPRLLSIHCTTVKEVRMAAKASTAQAMKGGLRVMAAGTFSTVAPARGKSANMGGIQADELEASEMSGIFESTNLHLCLQGAWAGQFCAAAALEGPMA